MLGQWLALKQYDAESRKWFFWMRSRAKENFSAIIQNNFDIK
jgi:hypothetical protein